MITAQFHAIIYSTRGQFIKHFNIIAISYMLYMPIAHSLILYDSYRKQKKLSSRKVSQLNGLHPNVGKTFAIFVSSVLKVLKKVIENFHKSAKLFCGLQYTVKPHLAATFLIRPPRYSGHIL